MYRLLHISDLHRSPTDPVGNAELISALVADHDRQLSETPAIGHYDAAIVSGDIIQGVTLGVPDSSAQLSAQYDTAYEFLKELTDRFFSGDRSRVVIVPGNHDVDWNVARSALEACDKPGENIGRLLAVHKSPFRWDWEGRQLYFIRDRALYERRLDRYRDFVRRFYADSIDPMVPDSRGNFDIFELWNRRMVVVAFNSCDENDCYRDQGAILEEAIARAHLAVRDRGLAHALKVAVWHHSIEGPPGLSDYMDVAIVRRMIDRGFRLGLHGHQHRADAMPRYIHLPEQTAMVVVSAGSLCAGARELPAGTHRQYNVVELSDDLVSCRVHVREVTTANVFAPALLRHFGGKSYLDCKWSLDRNEVGELINKSSSSLSSAVLAAEQSLQENKPQRAFDELIQYREQLPQYGRQLLVQTATELGEWTEVLSIIGEPTTSSDLVTIVEALIQLKEWERALSLLEERAPQLGLSEGQIHDLSNRVRARRAIRHGS